ncbi:hypothetical protein P3S68_003449 [Capsicum galapagoense]
MASRLTGVVSRFSNQKGYGFIKPDVDGTSEDVFVHQSEIKSFGFRTLSEGQKVEFIVTGNGGGKYQAVDVTGLGGAPLDSHHCGDSNSGYGNRGSVECYKCGRV